MTTLNLVVEAARAFLNQVACLDVEEVPSGSDDMLSMMKKWIDPLIKS